MRKRVLVMLALLVCLLVQMVPVSAAVDFSSVPTVAADVELISASAVSVYNGENVLVGYIGSMSQLVYVGDIARKVVTYRPSTGEYVCGKTSAITYLDDDGNVIESETFTCETFSSFEEALFAADVLTKGGTIYTALDMDAIALFVRDGSSIPEFKCLVPDLADHARDPFGGAKPVIDDLTPTLSVSVLSYLGDGDNVHGAKVRLSYTLPGYESFGRIIEEHGAYAYVDGFIDQFMCESKSSSGYVDFELDGLKNTQYMMYIKTDEGHRYSVPFIVDFITVAEASIYNGSWDAPTVVVYGLPSDQTTKVTAPLIVTLHASQPVTWSWNGVDIVDGLATEVDIPVVENGDYRYSAVTEVGKVSTGSVIVSCLLANDESEGLDLIKMGSSLVQTGIDFEQPSCKVVLILISGIIFAVTGVVVYKRKGEKE